MEQVEHEEIISGFLSNGEQLFNMGLYDELVGLCNEVLLNINDERVFSMLSSAEFARGNVDSAEEAARKGISLNPDNPDHLLNLAYILDHKGVFENALRYFVRARKKGD